jgi:hypothetical protein
MRAIPKKLLIHTVRLQRTIGKDRWGEGKTDGGVKLDKVRIEPSSRIVRDKNSAEIQLAATMFYDYRNSIPRNFVFKEDDIILFNGQKFRVHLIEPLYDGNRLHHYELGLIKHA